MYKHYCASVLAILGVILQSLQPAFAEPPAGAALELNKLESYDKGCRAYMVVNNASDVSYQALKLSLYVFQADGVIGQGPLSIELGPLKPQKKTVKLFNLEGLACDKIGSFLINSVMECKTETGDQADCLQRLKTTSLSNVQLSK